jgi:hypothetical protein
MLDQQPIGAFASATVIAHSHQHPFPVQPLALQREFQFPFLQRGSRVNPGLRMPVAAIPQLHGATAVLSLRDRAFEIAVLEWVVLDLDRQALIGRIERRAASDRPGFEYAIEFEPQVVVESARSVFLNDESQPLRRNRPRALPARSLRLSCPVEIALGAIARQFIGHSRCVLSCAGGRTVSHPGCAFAAPLAVGTHRHQAAPFAGCRPGAVAAGCGCESETGARRHKVDNGAAAAAIRRHRRGWRVGRPS